MRVPHLWARIVFVLFARAVYVISDTNTFTGGHITTDTTLRLYDSPFIVTSDIDIAPHATLTIEAGVELQFDEGVGIFVHGILVVDGTPDQRIILTSKNRYWHGVEWLPDAQVYRYRDGEILVTSSKSSLTFADITNAGKSGAAINVNVISPVFDNITVVNSIGEGIRLSNVINEGRIENSIIASNAGTGLFVSTTNSGSLLVDNTKITQNEGRGVHFGWNRPGEDSSTYDFCSFDGSVDDYVYLRHYASRECLRVSTHFILEKG